MLKEHAVENESTQNLQRLERQLRSLHTYTSYFDRAVAENACREMRPQELGVVIRDFYDTITPTSRRFGIDLSDPRVIGYDLFTCPMHTSEWVSILFNLFTNAKKAIRRAGRRGDILVSARREADRVLLDFADNGDGIPPENMDRIFDAFFTTTAVRPSHGDKEDDTGTGLGLTIARKIVTAYNGDVILVDPPEGYVTCFRIILPRATEEEVERYDN